MVTPTELEAGRTDARFVAWRKQMQQTFFAMFGATFVYAGLTLSGTMPPQGIIDKGDPVMHYSVLMGIVASTLILSLVVGVELRKKLEPQIMNEPYEKASAAAMVYVFSRMAFAEGVAILGLVSPFMISRKDFMIPLIVLGAVALVVTFRAVMPWAETMLLTRIARERLASG